MPAVLKLSTVEDFTKYAKQLLQKKDTGKLKKLVLTLKSEATKRKDATLKMLAKAALVYFRAALLAKAGDAEGAKEMAAQAMKVTAHKKAVKKVSKKKAVAKKVAEKKKAPAKKRISKREADLVAALQSGQLLGQKVVAVKNPRRRRNPEETRSALYHAAALGKHAFRGARSAYTQARAGWQENPAYAGGIDILDCQELDYDQFGRGRDFTMLKAKRGKVQQWLAERDGHVFFVELMSQQQLNTTGEIRKAIRQCIMAQI